MPWAPRASAREPMAVRAAAADAVLTNFRRETVMGPGIGVGKKDAETRTATATTTADYNRADLRITRTVIAASEKISNERPKTVGFVLRDKSVNGAVDNSRNPQIRAIVVRSCCCR